MDEENNNLPSQSEPDPLPSTPGSDNEPNRQEPQSPQSHHQLVMFRSVLVLSMIGSGISCLSNLMSGLMIGPIRTIYERGLVEVPEAMQPYYESMLYDMPTSFFIISGILNGISLAGVILMWRLRKHGFHYYSIAQLLLIVTALLLVGRAAIGIGDIMFTLLFIGFYYMALRSLASDESNR